MAHKAYENTILSNKINDILTTTVALNEFLNIDTSMTEGAGMKKIVNTYTSTGDVEALGMGEGNTQGIEVDFTSAEYDVVTYQGKFEFYDEQEMQDPMIVDTGLKHSTDKMVNKFIALAIAEYKKCSKEIPASAWDFRSVVSAIAELKLETKKGLSLYINPQEEAEFSVALADNLSYSEDFVRTGYIGSVAGIPVIMSNAVPAGEAYVASKDAVTLFLKKDTETEYEREAERRHNKYIVRKFGVVALTDDTKICRIKVGA